MTEQYWYYVYEWEVPRSSEKRKTMDVFYGSFADLILRAAKQSENWCVIFAKEITQKEFFELQGYIG